MIVSVMIAQILAQVEPVALPFIGEQITTGAIVSFVLWYLFNENQKEKAKNIALQDKYDTLLRDCHTREIDLIGRSNHSHRNEN
ncbi:hypothetical protein [Dyadobacter sp. CY312]|uniref:hypothetical protein n=1 Tax=Dyadobacter sp. CY312 TaxID=2907303 RepID=UPI001F3148EE|nr:hypothetical protein [Dyadobacter sp. CY312]MCE7039255.1 hypothetical protein [Dyadobacter sp. CY312]